MGLGSINVDLVGCILALIAAVWWAATITQKINAIVEALPKMEEKIEEHEHTLTELHERNVSRWGA